MRKVSGNDIMRTGRTQRRQRKGRGGSVRKSIFFFVVFTAIVLFSAYNGSGRVHAYEGRLESYNNKYYKSIEVQAGDTLWDIAEVYMDESYHSVNEYVNELIEINQLGSGKIHEGRYLTIVYRL